MGQVTAVGCALSAVTGAFCAVVSPFEAAVASAACFGVAGEKAAATSPLPGSFRVAFIDGLAALRPAAIVERLRLA